MGEGRGWPWLIGLSSGWAFAAVLGLVPLAWGPLTVEAQELGVHLAGLALLPGLPCALAAWALVRDPNAAWPASVVVGGTTAAVIDRLAVGLIPAPFSAPSEAPAAIFAAGAFLLAGTLAHRQAARAPYASLALALGPALTWLALSRPAAPPERAWRERGPELVLITVEALRADRLAAGHPATPHLQRLAARGHTQTLGISPIPRTGPAVRALFTGQGAEVSGAWEEGLPWEGAGAIAGELRAAGYRTGAAVGAAAVGAPFGFGHGFDAFDDDLAWVAGARGLPLGRLATLLWPAEAERSAAATVSRALRWWRKPSQGPRFLWVHLSEPHPPYRPPPPFDARFYGMGDPQAPDAPGIGPVSAVHAGHLDRITDPRWVEAVYDGEVATADAAIGALIAELGEGPVVVVVGLYGQGLAGDPSPWTHDALSEATLRVPVITAGPGVEVGMSDAPFALIDTRAALLRLTNLPGAAEPAAPRAAWRDPQGVRWLAQREAVRWSAMSEGGEGRAWLVTADGASRDLPAPPPAEAEALLGALRAGPAPAEGARHPLLRAP